MGDGVAIALSYYSDIRLSEWTLINITGGKEEDYDTKFNSFAERLHSQGCYALHIAFSGIVAIRHRPLLK